MENLLIIDTKKVLPPLKKGKDLKTFPKKATVTR